MRENDAGVGIAPIAAAGTLSRAWLRADRRPRDTLGFRTRTGEHPRRADFDGLPRSATRAESSDSGTGSTVGSRQSAPGECGAIRSARLGRTGSLGTDPEFVPSPVERRRTA